MSRPQDSKGSRVTRLLLVAVLVPAVVYFYVNYGREWFTLKFLKSSHTELTDYVATYPLQAALTYVLTMAAIIGFTVPGATFLSLLGGFLFRQPLAIAYAYLGYIFGATISYCLVRFVISSWAREYLSRFERFRDLEEQLQDTKNFWKTISVLVFIRYVAFFPFWFVNAVCALVDVGLGYFVLATCVSTVPGAAIYTLMGGLLSTMLHQLDENMTPSEVLYTLLWKSLKEDPVSAGIIGVLLSFCALFPVVLHYFGGMKVEVTAKTK